MLRDHATEETESPPDDEAAELPPVSVIMPVYNGEQYLVEAIESILNQTHQRFEFVIVDDGSTDRTWEILQRYAAADPRFRVFHQANMDQPPTLNRALGLARHAWVAVIDHDDISLPERLERQLRLVRECPDARLVGTHAIQVNAQLRELQRRHDGPTTPEEFRRLRASNGWLSLTHSSVLMHRDTILALGGYDPAFGPSADTELWSRVADEHLALVVPEPLVLYRIHSRSMSMTRYFEQKRALRWIRVRQLARRAGRPIPTVAELKRAERGRFGLRRPGVVRRDWLRYLKRQRRLALAEGRRARATATLAGIFALDLLASTRKLAMKVIPLKVPAVPPPTSQPEPSRQITLR